MKIILCGAPGAGKSDLAKRLARNLTRDGKGKWQAIDGYVDGLVTRTHMSIGEGADYEHNAMIMGERWAHEAEATVKGYHTITCGSMYETIFWASCLHSVIPAREDHMIESMQLAQLCMGFFGEMERRTFNYNAIFYVPWTDEQRAGRERTWEGVLDAKLPEVLDGMGRFAVPLVGTTKQKVTSALATIRTIRTDWIEPLTEAEQPAV